MFLEELISFQERAPLSARTAKERGILFRYFIVMNTSK